jgi:hypothetical protein
LLLGFAVVAPVATAQELPPPRNPAAVDTDWLLPSPAAAAPNDRQQAVQNAVALPPQNAQQQPPAPAAVAATGKKTPEQLQALYAARRRLQIERKQAAVDRMNQFKAARAAQEQKLYQDWHDRYIADAPVRVEYYRALAASYQSQPAVPYYTSAYSPYFYGAGPAIILPVIYGPVVSTPVCYRPGCSGTFFSWGW